MNNKKTTFYFLLSISIILLIAWVSLFVFINWKVNKKIESNEQTAKAVNLEVGEVLAIKRKFDSLQEVRNTIDGYFIERGNSFLVIEKIEEISRESGVILKINQAEELSSIQLNLSVVGNFKNLWQFIAMLENLPFKIRINNLILTKQNDSSPLSANLKNDESGDWRSNINLTISSFRNE